MSFDVNAMYHPHHMVGGFEALILPFQTQFYRESLKTLSLGIGYVDFTTQLLDVPRYLLYSETWSTYG